MHLKKSTSSDKVGDRRSNKLPRSSLSPFLFEKDREKAQYGILGLGLESPEAAQVVPSSSTPLFPLRACSYFVLCTARERVRIPFRSDKLQPQSWKTSSPPSPDLPPAAAGDGVAFFTAPKRVRFRQVPRHHVDRIQSWRLLSRNSQCLPHFKNPGGKSRDVPKRLSKQLRDAHKQVQLLPLHAYSRYIPEKHLPQEVRKFSQAAPFPPLFLSPFHPSSLSPPQVRIYQAASSS